MSQLRWKHEAVVQASLESSQPRDTSTSVVLSPGSVLGQNPSSREVFGKKQAVLNLILFFFNFFLFV